MKILKAAFIEETKKLKTGDPLKERKLDWRDRFQSAQRKILSYIKWTKKKEENFVGEEMKFIRKENAKWILHRANHYWRTYHDCRTNQEEIFGPVVTMMPFDTEEEVLKYANSFDLRTCRDFVDTKSQQNTSHEC